MRDAVVDMFCYRKYGHNEGDEPSYTQPVMYARVKAHPGTRSMYAQQLVRENVITEDDLKSGKEQVDELTKKMEAKIEEVVSKKQHELMDV